MTTTNALLEPNLHAQVVAARRWLREEAQVEGPGYRPDFHRMAEENFLAIRAHLVRLLVAHRRAARK